MEDLLGKVKEHTARVKDEAAKLGKQVYAKTNNVIGKTKISFAINETESKIKDVYAEIGKRVYEKYSAGGDVCEFAQELCENIAELEKEKSVLKEKLAELKESVTCAECGKHNSQESAYCSQCGSKLNTTMKNGNIEYEEEPIAVYTDDVSEAEEAAEVIDDQEEKKVKKVVTIKSKKPIED